jgi:excisionase family DNA binding protein
MLQDVIWSAVSFDRFGGQRRTHFAHLDKSPKNLGESFGWLSADWVSSSPVQLWLNLHYRTQIVHRISIRSMKTRTLEVRHLLTANQAATLLNCHPETLYKWVKEGRIGCIRTGRNLKFYPTHIEEYF